MFKILFYKFQLIEFCCSIEFWKQFCEILMEKDTFYLYIMCVEARSLRSSDNNGWSDPYAVFKLEKLKKTIGETAVIKRTLNPEWFQRFEYKGRISEDEVLHVDILDKDTFSKSDLLGVVNIPLNSFFNYKWNDKWYRLVYPDSVKPIRGSIHLRIHLTDDPETAFDIPFEEGYIAPADQEALEVVSRVVNDMIQSDDNVLLKPIATLNDHKEPEDIPQDIENHQDNSQNPNQNNDQNPNTNNDQNPNTNNDQNPNTNNDQNLNTNNDQNPNTNNDQNPNTNNDQNLNTNNDQNPNQNNNQNA